MWAQETQKILEAKYAQQIKIAESQETAAKNEVIKAAKLQAYLK